MKLLALFFVVFIAGSYQGDVAYASTITSHKIRPGDNVLSLLKKNGFTAAQREEILRRDSGIDELVLTTDLVYLKENTAGGVSLRIYDMMTDAAFRVWRKGKRAGIENYRPKWTVRIERHEGRLRGSLMANIKARTPSNWVASRFMDAFILDYDLSSLPAGTRFAYSVEKKYDAGVFVKYGEVREATLTEKGESFRREFVPAAGGGVFINPSDLIADRAFYAPVAYLRIASPFQKARRHPVKGRVIAHQGIDFEMPEGSPIYAPRRGIVVKRGRTRGAGYFVVLRHGDGTTSYYNHMNGLSAVPRVGTRVSAGKKIGEVGCTGYCTRPHLHFAIKVRGRMVDPAGYIKIYPAQAEEKLQKKVAAR